MPQIQETTLATLPGSSDTDRILVVLTNRLASGSRVELRQQSWCEQFGWYTQSTIEMEPQQVASLRVALGQAPKPPKSANRYATRNPHSAEFQPRIIRADSA